MLVRCVCVGTKYSYDYVEKLERGLHRHTTYDFDFDCITRSKYPGWWAKMELFPAKERTIYLDLDVIILGNIDFLFEYKGPFCIMKNFGGVYNSSVMSIAPGFGEEMKKDFVAESSLIMRYLYYGDQDYFEAKIPDADTWPVDKVVSYKQNYCGEMGPQGASIVICHGEPKPPELLYLPWVKEAWI